MQNILDDIKPSTISKANSLRIYSNLQHNLYFDV